MTEYRDMKLAGEIEEIINKTAICDVSCNNTTQYCELKNTQDIAQAITKHIVEKGKEVCIKHNIPETIINEILGQ